MSSHFKNISGIVKWMPNFIKRKFTSPCNNSDEINRNDIIQYIPGIFQHEMNKKVKKFHRIKEGTDCMVFSVSVDDSTYILKIPDHNRIDYIYREFQGCTRLKGIVPVPKIFCSSALYIIQEYIPGLNLEEIKPGLSEEEKQKIYIQTGQLLNKIHSIKMNGFGPVDKYGNGIYFTAKEFIDKLTKKPLYYLKDKNIVSGEQFGVITEYLNHNRRYGESSQSVLLHFDFGDYNIRIHEGKISGIVDFGDLSAGPRELDLARPFIHHYTDGMFEYIRQGYGDIDNSKVQYFTLVILLRLLPYYHRGGYKKEFRNSLKILNEIVPPHNKQ